MRAAFAALALLAACAGASPSAADGEAIEASYPEGPLYQGETLYYAEMGADRISVIAPGQGRRTFFEQRACGPTALAPFGEGFLVLCHIGARVVAVDVNGRALRSWNADVSGEALMDPNDASADGRGGVYFSDPGLFSRRTEPHGKVMHLTAEGRLSVVARTLWYPNGVFVDQRRGQLYVSEHMMGRVLRYPIAADGALGEQTTFVTLSDLQRSNKYPRDPYLETGPDGLEIGPDGDVWVAVYGEGRILRLTPEGALRGILELPARYSTNISFASNGSAATTSIFNNTEPPFRGEVRFHQPEALTPARQ
ncbi:gluconolactonase [alpha proteobacterium U9-1i]|nr:gluconolactonase [alpha proteobacterium U9-1i]